MLIFVCKTNVLSMFVEDPLCTKRLYKFYTVFCNRFYRFLAGTVGLPVVYYGVPCGVLRGDPWCMPGGMLCRRSLVNY